LSRVALVEGSRVVNSSQGGGSKDTWVLASRASAADRELGAAEIVRSLPESMSDPELDGASRSAEQQPEAEPPRDGRTPHKRPKKQKQQQQQQMQRMVR
jgi:hypothetical protein